MSLFPLSVEIFSLTIRLPNAWFIWNSFLSQGPISPHCQQVFFSDVLYGLSTNRKFPCNIRVVTHKETRSIDWYNFSKSWLPMSLWLSSQLRIKTFSLAVVGATKWHDMTSILKTTEPQKCYHMIRISEPQTGTNGPWSGLKKCPCPWSSEIDSSVFLWEFHWLLTKCFLEFHEIWQKNTSANKTSKWPITINLKFDRGNFQ